MRLIVLSGRSSAAAGRGVGPSGLSANEIKAYVETAVEAAVETAVKTAVEAAVEKKVETAVERAVEAAVQAAKLRNSGRRTTNTLAEHYAELVDEQECVHSRDLDRVLDNVCVNWWPVNASTSFPGLQAKEVADCQPFFTKMMTNFTSGLVKVLDSPPDPTKQRKKRKSREVKVWSVPNPHAYKQHTIGNTSPDAVYYDGCNKVGTAAITFGGEVKGVSAGDFPANEMGQVIDFMERLFPLQPFRKTLYAFLTDGDRVVFFRGSVSEKTDKARFEFSSTFRGRAGWQVGRSAFTRCRYVFIFNSCVCLVAALRTDVHPAGSTRLREGHDPWLHCGGPTGHWNFQRGTEGEKERSHYCGRGRHRGEGSGAGSAGRNGASPRPR